MQGCLSQHVGDPPTLVTENLFPNLSLAHPPSPYLSQMAGCPGSQALAVVVGTAGGLAEPSAAGSQLQAPGVGGEGEGMGGREARGLGSVLFSSQIRAEELGI